MALSVDPAHSDIRELVAFRVGGQDFCIDIMAVREIRGWAPVTLLPHAPDHVMGVINLRGAVVPIVNLARRLGLTPPEPDARHVIIIAMIHGQIVGLLVDAVSDILGVARASIQPAPSLAAETMRPFLEGVIATEGRMLRLIDLEAILPPCAPAPPQKTLP